MELPLRDLRGRARRSARAATHAVVAGDPRGRRAVVPRQRLAGRAPAARDARGPARRRRRPRGADRRRTADRRGDRPHGRASAAARIDRRRCACSARRASSARCRTRCCACCSASAASSGPSLEPERDALARRRRAWSSSRFRAGRRRGERVRLPRPRDRRRRHLRPRRSPRSTTTCSPASPPATSCSWTGRSGATTSSRDWASRSAARTTWATCRSPGPAARLEALAGLERPRKVLVHINNTNPILLEDSPERELLPRSGVEVAYDGLEVEL